MRIMYFGKDIGLADLLSCADHGCITTARNIPSRRKERFPPLIVIETHTRSLPLFVLDGLTPDGAAS